MFRALVAGLTILMALPVAAQPAGSPIRADACLASEPECVPPPLAREFRGVWVATVANMDWPSRPGLPADSAQLELRVILDHAAHIGLNAVVLQVRPAGDAMYASSIEPWSEYLTGRQGRPPDRRWDPLTFAVREAHARGLELHAWFNPYRARHTSAKGPIARTHFSRQYPAYAKPYGRQVWFDPGEPAVRRRTVRVVLDVVRRYDVDGVHLDDYFYPYPEQRRGRDVPFPDARSYARYQRGGGTLALDDWRRQNVDRLVDTLRREIARIKPWVKFGISPFGIWRPGEPETARGFDAWARLFADARKWLQNGWVDYLVPQLYWGIEQEGQRFAELLRWWQAQNDSARYVWPGLATFRIAAERSPWRSTEVLRQIDTARAAAPAPGVAGAVHFAMTTLLKDQDSIATRLGAGPYAERAVPPALPWKGATAPRTPAIAVTASRRGETLVIARRPDDDVRWWAIQSRHDDRWQLQLVEGSRTEVPLKALNGGLLPAIVALRPISRTGVEGAPAVLLLR